MKNIILSITSALLLVGCASDPSAGPILLKTGVSFGAQYALLKNPNAKPAVEESASLICASAHGTNVSPAEIVAAVNKYGQQTPESLLIVNSAISLYSLTYNGLKSTNTAAAQPYAIALCEGLVEALALSSYPTAIRVKNSVPILIDGGKWPQVKQ